MKVLPVSDVAIETFANDPGVFFNGTKDVALIAPPTMNELRRLCSQFEAELRAHLRRLFQMPVGEVTRNFGLLGQNEANMSLHAELCWAALPQTNAGAKGLLRVNQVAALSAAVDAGLMPDTGKEQQKYKGGGSFASFLAALPRPSQEHFVEHLFSENRELDAILRLGQGKELGLKELQLALANESSPETFLSKLALEADEYAKMGTAYKLRAGSKRQHAAIWFADYLARENVWLLPLEYAEGATSHYPMWLQPIQLWMTFPQRMHKFADQLLRDHFAPGAKQSSSSIVHIAVKLGLCSDSWRVGGLCAGPLIEYKRAALSEEGKSSGQRSWAVNRLWDSQLSYFGAAANEHPDAHAFVLGKRLVSAGRRPFEWVHRPNARNARQYTKIYGHQPVAFSGCIKKWASDLEELLPLFGVEAIELKVHSLNLWLLYLAGLPNPPQNLEGVEREIHIRPARGSATGFRQFLIDHVAEGAQGARGAIRTLRQAWQLAAVQDGFLSRRTNPIDRGDSPFDEPARKASTVRSALDPRVSAIISGENLADGMSFARAWGRKKKLCWRSVRCPDTGEMISIFFPAAPVLVNIVMRTGMRGMQARWLDSGEGDEFRLDIDTLTNVKNSHPFAELGRREGFLRVCEILREGREKVLGMWVNSGKSGPFEVPWVDEAVVGPIRDLIETQGKYFPIERSVPIELEANFLSEFRKFKGTSFPLARDPNYKLGYPLSANNLRSYWRALLRHCQSIIDTELGYHYPLFDGDGNPLFDIHGLRVTIVTTLLENGVPPSVLTVLLGHGCVMMTLYYEDVPASKVHTALQSALDKSKRALDDGAFTDEMATEFADESVTFRSEEDFVGRSLLLDHRQTGTSFDIFANGICPGGRCETGGEAYGQGRFKPVWRPRACSACRYRITGPAFLNGLVHRANTLMWEIKVSMDREAQLYAVIETEEDLGRPVAHLRRNIRREIDLRDKLFFEWSTELRTIKAAEDILKEEVQSNAEQPAEGALVPSARQSPRVSFQETHRFELANRLLKDSVTLQDVLDLSADVELYRDHLLARIAEANDLTEWFRSLDERVAAQAKDMFADILIAQLTTVEDFDAMIEGFTNLRNLPEFSAAVAPLHSLAAAGCEDIAQRQ